MEPQSFLQPTTWLLGSCEYTEWPTTTTGHYHFNYGPFTCFFFLPRGTHSYCSFYYAHPHIFRKVLTLNKDSGLDQKTLSRGKSRILILILIFIYIFFLGGGGGGAQNHREREVPFGRDPGPALGILMLSWTIWALFISILIPKKTGDKKKHSPSFFFGGGGERLLRSSKSATVVQKCSRVLNALSCYLSRNF